MDTPATLADALTALNAANVRSTELSAEVAALNELLAEAGNAVSEKTRLSAEVEALNAKNNDLAQQLAAVVNSVKTIDDQAAALVASAGHPPLEIAPNPDTVAKTETLAERLANVSDPSERSRIRAEFLSTLKN
jgi:putative intracellular protease/amidase